MPSQLHYILAELRQRECVQQQHEDRHVYERWKFHNHGFTILTVSGAGFNAGGISSGLILTPGQTASLTATFAPSGSGSVTGSVSVASNATNSPDFDLLLSGTGVAVVNHSVGLSWLPSTSKVMGYNTYSSEQSGGRLTPNVTSTPLAATSYKLIHNVHGRNDSYYFYVVTSVDSSNTESGYSQRS